MTIQHTAGQSGGRKAEFPKYCVACPIGSGQASAPLTADDASVLTYPRGSADRVQIMD